MAALPIEVLCGIYLGLLTGIIPGFVSAALGFAFLYITGVTLPGHGVVALAVDAFEADRLAPARRHRLLTLPREPSTDREFASLLRAVDERVAAARIAPESPLVGIAVGAPDVTVVAAQPTDGRVEPLPPRHRVLAADETVYVVGRSDVIRRFERAAGANEADPRGVEAETTS